MRDLLSVWMIECLDQKQTLFKILLNEIIVAADQCSVVMKMIDN